MAEDVVGFVIEQDAENLVIDQALGQLGGAAKDLFDGERGVGFAADFVQQQKRFGLTALVLVELGVFDGGADARRDQRENRLLVGSEIIELAAFDVQNADDAAADDQRDGEFGANGIERRSGNADRSAHRRREWPDRSRQRRR